MKYFKKLFVKPFEYELGTTGVLRMLLFDNMAVNITWQND